MAGQHDALRADAQQNRHRILEAARDALATSGDASLNSIAKKAGVGPGTLYRHFPNREALVLAVYRYDMQQLADTAPKLLAESPPIEALRLWLDQLAHYGMIKHGLAGVLHTATSDGLVGETYEPLIGAITQLLRACAEDGSIRAGHDPDDVLLILGALWRIDPGPGAEARAGRLLDFVMAGLRADAPNGPETHATVRARSGRPQRTRRRSLIGLPAWLSALSLSKSPAALPARPPERPASGKAGSSGEPQ
jgi:AcrR family transcriptional regulator